MEIFPELTGKKITTVDQLRLKIIVFCFIIIRLGGDLNRRTPMTLSSNGNEFGLRFISSLFFNFRGMKLQYLVQKI